MRKFLSSVLVSASLIAAPAVAAPSAQSLSLSNARVGAATSGENELAQGSGGIIALVILAGIVAIGVLAATQDESSDSN